MTKSYIPATLLLDFYKVSHRTLYPEGTEFVYSNWTPRSSRIEGVNHVVHFGAQKFIKELVSTFDDNFFKRPKQDVLSEYSRLIKHSLGDPNPQTKHLEELYDLGYLPLHIRSLAEGTLVPVRVPTMTIHNTDKRFFWLTNYIETIASCSMWQATTSATIAREYRDILNKFAMETTGSTAGVEFQGHDFSMRGMSSLDSAVSSGLGHLLSFVGTDTVPAIFGAENFYGANIESELIGTSIPATEHSIMCAYGLAKQYDAYKRIITEVHPTGFVSIVSDTWNLWEVLSDVISPLKQEILARDGRVVVRPDSGCPIKIMCGDPEGKTEYERKGVVEVLWDIFGGTVTAQGYKVLDSHIGAIYGDSITRDRATAICQQLKDKGFASVNAVFGIGSYTYQYNTRDTFGFAMKSTLCIINGEEIQIYKDPFTDDGVKKSAKGGVRVYDNNGVLAVQDQLFLADTAKDTLLRDVFIDGKLLIDEKFSDIRARVLGTL